MSRFEQRKRRRLRNAAVRSGYRSVDAELRLVAALDEARREMGVTQEELAKRLGRSQAAVSQFFGAETGITVGRLVEYLDALGLQMRVDLANSRDEDPPISVREVAVT